MTRKIPIKFFWQKCIITLSQKLNRMNIFNGNEKKDHQCGFD